MFGKDEKAEVIFSGDPNHRRTVYWRGLREHLHVRMAEQPTRRMTMSQDVLERVRNTNVPIKGTIAEYIAAVAKTNGVGVLGTCEVVSCKTVSGRCVRMTVAPCANTKKKDGCEGVEPVVTIGFSADNPILIEVRFVFRPIAAGSSL